MVGCQQIISGLMFIGSAFFFEETYQPILEYRKARTLRKAGDTHIYSKLDLERTDVVKKIPVILIRPFEILLQEPILAALTLYMSFVYGIIYMMFEAYPGMRDTIIVNLPDRLQVIFIELRSLAPG